MAKDWIQLLRCHTGFNIRCWDSLIVGHTGEVIRTQNPHLWFEFGPSSTKVHGFISKITHSNSTTY